MVISLISSLIAVSVLLWQGIASHELAVVAVNAESHPYQETQNPTPLSPPPPTTTPFTPTITPTPINATPTPSDLPSPSPAANCDFSYHYDSREDGPPPDGQISVEHHCREESASGQISNSVDLDINTGSKSNSEASGDVKINVNLENR